MSKDQQVQAVRVANIPTAEFEEVVDGPSAPTITKLAEGGEAPAPPSAASRTTTIP
ncbi:hypothetical protein [Mesorhizobium sp. M1406]|uniref:hypothetical protein n=1 Tax=Mesorhizobium sp. M1406 TaxID=2957099 RepID=UPI003336D8C2